MIYAYGITLQGTYHVKNNIVCQDAHEIVRCSDEMIIAAVADGLGSERHSDVASSMAAKISTSYCTENITALSSTEEIKDIIKASFSVALRAIEKEVAERGHDMDQYDTTLSLAVLIGDVLYYGHSGDSGIVALTSDGLYEKVTEQQRDEDDHVFPLFFEDRWVFGQFDKKVCSVFLATDGMLEPLFPALIKEKSVNIHVNLARFFMDNRSLNIAEEGEDAVQARIKEFVENIPDAQVNDDKTVVVLVNTSAESKLQPEDYYKEPDWAEIKRRHDEEWKRMAYPHLFKDKAAEDEQGTSAPDESIPRVETDNASAEADIVCDMSADLTDLGKEELSEAANSASESHEEPDCFSDGQDFTIEFVSAEGNVSAEADKTCGKPGDDLSSDEKETAKNEKHASISDEELFGKADERDIPGSDNASDIPNSVMSGNITEQEVVTNDTKEKPQKKKGLLGFFRK